MSTVLQKTAEEETGVSNGIGGDGESGSIPWMTSHLKEVQTLRWTRRLSAAVMEETDC